MTIITGLTDQPNQQFTVLLPDGSRCKLTMNFRVQQAGWFMDLLWTRTDGTQFAANGLRMTTMPNLTRQFLYSLNFGFSVVTDDNLEATRVKDFDSGYAKLLLLDATDLATIEAQVFPGL